MLGLVGRGFAVDEILQRTGGEKVTLCVHAGFVDIEGFAHRRTVRPFLSNKGHSRTLADTLQRHGR